MWRKGGVVVVEMDWVEMEVEGTAVEVVWMVPNGGAEFGYVPAVLKISVAGSSDVTGNAN